MTKYYKFKTSKNISDSEEYSEFDKEVPAIHYTGDNKEEVKEFVDSRAHGKHLYIFEEGSGGLMVPNNVWTSLFGEVGCYILEHPIYGVVPISENLFNENYIFSHQED